MRGVFDDRELQQAETGHEREVTLGSVTLLLIFFGLVLLCGLCFGLGYATGHRGTQEAVAAQATANQPASQPSNQGQPSAPADDGQPKPSADSQVSGAASQPGGPPEQPLDADAIAAGGGAPSPANAAASAAANGTPQVKQAFGSAPAQAGSSVGPAIGSAAAPAGSLMVQIAAVSQQTDADVLMSALRKHGYAVVAQREPLDGLIHVRIGPFKTRDEAEKSRIKLLNDGYNAVVQP
jgi:DedD protein